MLSLLIFLSSSNFRSFVFLILEIKQNFNRSSTLWAIRIKKFSKSLIHHFPRRIENCALGSNNQISERINDHGFIRIFILPFVSLRIVDGISHNTMNLADFVRPSVLPRTIIKRERSRKNRNWVRTKYPDASFPLFFLKWHRYNNTYVLFFFFFFFFIFHGICVCVCVCVCACLDHTSYRMFQNSYINQQYSLHSFKQLRLHVLRRNVSHNTLFNRWFLKQPV